MKCGIGYFKSGSDCLTVCPNGKYGDYITRTCESCYSSCSSCKGASEFNCLSCSSADNYLLFSNSGSLCVSECPSGYFNISNYTNPYNTSLTNTKFC